ncbi:MAG: protein kinase [Armatimonadetes bacterium]|nr:protein kinase [Armatimonadota bacterium]
MQLNSTVQEGQIFNQGDSVRLNNISYKVIEYINRGGSGEVYKVTHNEQSYALKIFFPFYQAKLFTTIADEAVNETIPFQLREFEILSSLHHKNIVAVREKGEIDLTQKQKKKIQASAISKLPALVTDFVEGLPINEYFAQNKLGDEDCANILVSIAEALQYMHNVRKRMHLDIKAANLLIRSSDSQPILVDFGLSKNFDFEEVDKNEMTRLLGDWDLFPKSISTNHRLKHIKEVGGTREELFQAIFPGLDLYQFGKLLAELAPTLKKTFRIRENNYVGELIHTLTDWKLVSKLSTTSLLPRIERLRPNHFTTFGIQELISPSAAEKTIMLPTGIAVPVTENLKRGIECRSFRRLNYVNQLCLLPYIYPGADYKRSVHVLYAYELGRQLVEQLYSCPTFRLHFDGRSTEQLLACILFHDINHFPFLHIFQESGIQQLKGLDVLELFCDGQATGEMAAKSASVNMILDDLGLDSKRFEQIVFGKHYEQCAEHDAVDQIINSIVNSGVDIDKLSYLKLDSLFTGVAYGNGIDVVALLKAASIERINQGRLHLAFDERALQAVESVIFTRYWLFRSVYWHHTNRALMAMVLSVVKDLYSDGRRSFHEYLTDTMWRSDYEAIRYLDQKYMTHFGKPSVLSGLIEDRNHLYQRLYTIHPSAGEERDFEIYEKCRNLSDSGEKEVREKLLHLILCIANIKEHESFGVDDILLDVPRRENDFGGKAYIRVDRGEAVEVEYLSETIRHLQEGYELLSKRVRFFVSPRVGKALGPSFRIEHRNDIGDGILQILKGTDLNTQVK